MSNKPSRSKVRQLPPNVITKDQQYMESLRMSTLNLAAASLTGPEIKTQQILDRADHFLNYVEGKKDK